MDKRDVKLTVFFDPNSRDSLDMLEMIKTDDDITAIEIQRVSKFIPCIRDVPAIGVTMWATDLQGIVQSVDNFKQYIENEAENKQALINAEEIALAYVDLLTSNIIEDNKLEVE